MKKSDKSNSSDKKGKSPQSQLNFEVLNNITDRAYFIALEMIDIANHKRGTPEKGEPKVGGHPSACASSKHILSAIHLVMRKPEDYFAHKPHISPMDHALNYLMRNFWTPENEPMDDAKCEKAMHHLRHYTKDEPVFQSYHAEADPDSHRFFPSGSVGIPPVNALYMSLAYDFARHHEIDVNEDPTFWCLMGDSEFREGSLMEAMPDAGERQLGNLVWIVDYNRQNLDGTRIFNEKAMGGTDAERIVTIAAANGWHAIQLKHGKLREKLFKQPGGDELKRVLDEVMTEFEYQALLASHNPELMRKALLRHSSKLKGLLSKLSDEELYRVFTNLGGHDLESLVEVFTEAKNEKNKPTLIVAYTIKGHGLKCAAMSGNHSALPEEDELKAMAKKLGASHEEPFAHFSDDSEEGAYLKERHDTLVVSIGELKKDIAARKQEWIDFARNEIQWPDELDISALKFNPFAHTQWMWGQIAAKMDRFGRGLEQKDSGPGSDVWAKVGKYFLTMAPDVGSSTNTSPNMNGKLYGDIQQEDYEAEFDAKDDKAPDIVPKLSEKSGHIRFEIAEGNCMSAAGSFGKFFHFTGVPFFPAMTIYDFFIKRALDQYYYNVYWHSSFAVIGTPSGVTLAPEGAQHSWKSDIQMPNSVTWEPCFAKELEWIMADMFRRHFTVDNEGREGVLIRGVTKGVAQKDLLERTKKQLRFQGLAEKEIMEVIRQDVLAGGYALIDYRGAEGFVPGDNVVNIFAMGALVPEAIKASDLLLEKGIFANVFVVTSPDLLLGNFAYENKYSHLKQGLGVDGNLYLRTVESNEVKSLAGWYDLQGARIPVLSVHDGEPGLLDNIGSIVGVKHKSLSIRKTSKSGTTAEIFRYHHLDAESIAEAADEILADTAEERFLVDPQVLSKLNQNESA